MKSPMRDADRDRSNHHLILLSMLMQWEIASKLDPSLGESLIRIVKERKVILSLCSFGMVLQLISTISAVSKKSDIYT